MPTTSTTGPGPVHRIDQAIEAPNVGMLLKRIEQIYHPSARLTDEAAKRKAAALLEKIDDYF